MEIILLGILAGVSLVSYSLYKKTRSGAPAPPLSLPDPRGLPRRQPGAEPTLQNLLPGDVVQHLERDWLVEGVLLLDEDGRLLRLYHLVDGDLVRWLAVRSGPGEVDPLLLAELRDLDVPFHINAPEQLTVAGSPYQLAARGAARISLAGVAPRPPSDHARLYEYEGAGGRWLLALAFTHNASVFAGAPVSTSSLVILPGA